jgi:hypothetical protein
MIEGFRDETEELNEHELRTVVPLVVRGLKVRIGKDNAITNKVMLAGLLDNFQLKIDPSRMRKVINHIRTKQLIFNVISSRKGYWVSNDPTEIETYIESLRQRISSIERVADSFIYK